MAESRPDGKRFALAPAAAAGVRQDHVTVIFNAFDDLTQSTGSRRALARALRESGQLRAQAVRETLAFREARHTRYPDKVESERARYITEGFPAGRYVVEAVEDKAPALSPEEEAGIEAALDSYRQGRVVDAKRAAKSSTQP